MAVLANVRGVAAIEIAMTLPVLLMLSIGAFDVSRMIAKRLDYQQAAAEVATLVIAVTPEGTTNLRAAAATASGLDPSNITVTLSMTCNGVASTDAACGAGQEQARYVTLTLNGQYAPVWTHFGVPQTVNMTVTRKVRYQ